MSLLVVVGPRPSFGWRSNSLRETKRLLAIAFDVGWEPNSI